MLWSGCATGCARWSRNGTCWNGREKNWRETSADMKVMFPPGRREKKQGKPRRILEQVRQMEARYAAVTAGVSQELQELEQQERRASGRCSQAKRELEHLCGKYGLTPGEWDRIPYNRKEEAHQESLLE